MTSGPEGILSDLVLRGTNSPALCSMSKRPSVLSPLCEELGGFEAEVKSRVVPGLWGQ